MRTNNEGIESHQQEARKRVSEAITGFIERQGLSVYKFSQMAGISQSQLQLIIDGKTNPTMDVLLKISAVTGRTIELSCEVEA